jgi:hypothetical protein
MFLQMGLDSDFPQSLSGKSKRERRRSSNRRNAEKNKEGAPSHLSLL